MGKRKSSSKPVAKGRKEPLSTTFKCLFCNHEKAVTVVLKDMFGRLKCKDCQQRFQSPINNLSAAIDVYADWVDACEEVRLAQPPKQRPQRKPDTLTNHGFAGGARMTIQSKEADAEADAEGEDEDDDADSLDARPAKRSDRRADPDRDEGDEDGGFDRDDEDEERDSRGKGDKRQRVEVEDGDEDEDD